MKQETLGRKQQKEQAQTRAATKALPFCVPKFSCFIQIRFVFSGLGKQKPLFASSLGSSLSSSFCSSFALPVDTVLLHESWIGPYLGLHHPSQKTSATATAQGILLLFFFSFLFVKHDCRSDRFFIQFRGPRRWSSTKKRRRDVDREESIKWILLIC